MSDEEMLKRIIKDLDIYYSDAIVREVLFLTWSPLILFKSSKGCIALGLEELRATIKQVEELKRSRFHGSR